MKLFKFILGCIAVVALTFYSFKAQGQSPATFTANVSNAPVSKGGSIAKFVVGNVEFKTATKKQERLSADGAVETFYVYSTKEAVVGSMTLTDRFFNFNGKPQKGFVYRSAKPSKKTGLYSFYIVMENPNAPGHFGKHKIEAAADE